MELNEAFVRAIRSYYKGDALKETNNLIAGDDSEKPGVMYTKEYFDDMAVAAKEGELEEEEASDARSAE